MAVFERTGDVFRDSIGSRIASNDRYLRAEHPALAIYRPDEIGIERCGDGMNRMGMDDRGVGRLPVDHPVNPVLA